MQTHNCAPVVQNTAPGDDVGGTRSSGLPIPLYGCCGAFLFGHVCQGLPCSCFSEWPQAWWSKIVTLYSLTQEFTHPVVMSGALRKKPFHHLQTLLIHSG